MPDWYNDEPAEVRGDDFYMRAFWELSSERSYGQTLGPIPWSKVVQYGERRGLDQVMVNTLEVVIREMDETYLKDLRDQQMKRNK